LRGKFDANIRFEELCHLLQAKGFRMRVSGSRHIFTRTMAWKSLRRVAGYWLRDGAVR
jgi:hypothetical protein